jgi:prolyl 4-hydroxylase
MTTNFMVCEDFLTKEECDELINLAKPKLEKMRVLSNTGGTENSTSRIADGVWLNRNDSDIIKLLQDNIAIASGLPSENQEKLHIVRYGIGGKYDAHFDYFEPNSGYFKNAMSNGGQRTQTWIIYLNDDYNGGETEFPRENIKILPKMGKLIGWNNLTEENELNEYSQHAGLPVLTGEKWIAVIWVRQYARNNM